MKFHPVQASGAGAPGPIGKLRDGGLDLFARHRTALEAVKRVRLAGRTERAIGQVLDPGNVLLPSGIRQLQQKPAVVAMHGLADLAPERHARIAVDQRVAGHHPAAKGHRHMRRDDGANAAARELLLPADPNGRARAVVVIEPARDVGPKEPVLHGEVPEPQRNEDRVVIHDGRLLRMSACRACRAPLAATPAILAQPTRSGNDVRGHRRSPPDPCSGGAPCAARWADNQELNARLAQCTQHLDEVAVYP